MVSIRIVKICDVSICKPLTLIFQPCLESGKFPSERTKKASTAPIHNRGDKQIIEKYQPISLLPITGRIIERLLYDRIFEFFGESRLISVNQSGFKPGDSCVYQLLSVSDEIYH